MEDNIKQTNEKLTNVEEMLMDTRRRQTGTEGESRKKKKKKVALKKLVWDKTRGDFRQFILQPRERKRGIEWNEVDRRRVNARKKKEKNRRVKDKTA